MRYAPTVLALTLAGCSGDVAPRAPVDPSPPVTSLWGMVVDASGVCITGATVQVVRGQSLGETVTQRTPCDAWAYDGGFVFNALTPGVEMTLRASAPGYAAQERTVVPTLGPQTAVVLTPSSE